MDGQITDGKGSQTPSGYSYNRSTGTVNITDDGCQRFERFEVTGSLRAIELFAGVGGFRLGLEESGWKVVWSNQYEPSSKTRQHASEIYRLRFKDKKTNHVNRDINDVLEEMEMSGNGVSLFPKHDLLVGGFPCQDYSVARVLNQAAGLLGQKGVLWWSIFRLLKLLKSEDKQPRFLLLENVDRLIKSPANQRGRDFAVMLASLQVLGYRVEWRVVNAAEYGFPQRRRRVFIVGQLSEDPSDDHKARPSAKETIFTEGILAQALPVDPLIGTCPFDLVSGFPLSDRPLEEGGSQTNEEITLYLQQISESFGAGVKKTRFRNAGVMIDGIVHTVDVKPVDIEENEKRVLRDVVEEARTYRINKGLPMVVGEQFYLDASNEDEEGKWEKLKNAKSEFRIHRASGFEYHYTEGKMDFPDSLDKASRTILTGEGGSAPSRFKHVIWDGDRKRRLTPEELELLNGFPPGHTKSPEGCPPITDGKRAFLMGNAVVVGIVAKIGSELAKRAKATKNRNDRAAAIKKSPSLGTSEELVATSAD